MNAKGFTKDIQIELWARMGLIFEASRASARGSIFNELLIGPKTSNNLKNPVGDSKKVIWGCRGWRSSLLWVPLPHTTTHTQQEPEPPFESYLVNKDSESKTTTQIKTQRLKDSNPETQLHTLREWLQDSSHAGSADFLHVFGPRCFLGRPNCQWRIFCVCFILDLSLPCPTPGAFSTSFHRLLYR